MKERKLDFDTNDNPAIVEDPNGEILEELTKLYKDNQSNLGLCINLLAKGKLTEGMKENILSLTDYNVTQFLTKMGYEGVLAKKEAKYAALIRSLNDENRKLRQQNGEKVSNEDVRERLKIMENSFKAWWSEFGFGHCIKFSFNGYSAEAILSGMVFPSRANAQSEESKDKYLSNLGFKIDDRQIIYTDQSIGLLKKLLTDKYPSIDICNINLTTSALKGIPLIHEVIVYISDLDELSETPITQ